MSFCSEFAEKQSAPRPTPKRAYTLEGHVAAMDWDLTGLSVQVKSLERSRRWYRAALVIIIIVLIWMVKF